MSGLLLRLAGPLQSWGEHSAFADRDTQSFPTRSGLIGLFAAAYGMRRGELLNRFDKLRFIVRVDQAGLRLTDFQTVGGGRVRHHTVPTAEGGRRSLETATVVSRRHYLSDACFTVGVTGPADLIASLGERLAKPRWHPYLGRRSCPPDQPMLLRHADDPHTELTDHVPLPRWLPEQGPATVDFVIEGERDAATAVTQLWDVPVSFARLARRFLPRTVSIMPLHVSEHLWLGKGRTYQEALLAYAKGDR